MADTQIEWTDSTWNPVAGCTIMSAGCRNCYAMQMARRLEAMGVDKYKGLTRKSGARTIWKGVVREDESALDIPLRWRKARKIFVNSMSDLFHRDVPLEYIQRCFEVMEQASQHTFQILTKRPDHAAEIASQLPWPANVWMGTSVENAGYLDRIDQLRRIPAAVRFLSIEPLLGPLPKISLAGIQWVIVGGESGPGARPMKPEWVTAIRDQCVKQRVPFFFKQWGGPNKSLTGRTLEGRTWDEMPKLGGNQRGKRKVESMAGAV